ncbi:MAG: TOBE domain-containing protein [Chloroflexaceae bacterium]|nr:TOBE domain-containing protein [Chloroflexaceae bacterium]
MEISARNQLAGTVQDVTKGQVMAEVVVKLDGGEEIVSVITVSSVERLNLTVGSKVTVIIKSTEVMLATA